MVADFQVEIRNEKPFPIVDVSGEIDVYTCPKLHEILKQVISSGGSQVILNLQSVQYIDSTGLGTIAHSARELEGKSGKILIISNKPQIKKIFEISGLGKKNIELFEDESNAVDSLN